MRRYKKDKFNIYTKVELEKEIQHRLKRLAGMERANAPDVIKEFEHQHLSFLINRLNGGIYVNAEVDNK